jgi:hypothetical protein
MDRLLTTPDGRERIDGGDQNVSRRAFFHRARLGLIAVAGVTVFGIVSSTGGARAAEDDEDEKKKEEKSKPRDKDQEAKEKERESKAKEKKEKSSDENEENKSNTKKKKNKNGDDKEKKKKKSRDEAAASPYDKYVEKGNDRYGCTDFSNQFDAQQVLRLSPKDPNNLDGNRNGIACDGQDAFMDGVAAGLMGSPFDLNPVPRP